MKSKIIIHKGGNVFGISTGFLKNPASFMLAHEKRLGDIFKITLPIKNDFILTSDADFVEYISLKNEKNYPKSKIHWKTMRILLGKTVATSDGDEWKYHKQIIQPSFNKSALEPFFKRFEEDNKRHKFAFMPFGAGKHSCITKHLAMPQLVRTLAFFVQNFDFEVVDIDNLEFKAEILFKPKNVFIKLINRKTSKI